eukprot:gb/GEZN01005622.1/.p1 GENE.gb/GEZN01005622.1/~~gb/GEZN01005622.1/.p1  ORF type:complete len:367 (+),score=33.51 gb/GEZN01005622.1/:63-1163(+)
MAFNGQKRCMRDVEVGAEESDTMQPSSAAIHTPSYPAFPYISPSSGSPLKKRRLHNASDATFSSDHSFGQQQHKRALFRDPATEWSLFQPGKMQPPLQDLKETPKANAIFTNLCGSHQGKPTQRAMAIEDLPGSFLSSDLDADSRDGSWDQQRSPRLINFGGNANVGLVFGRRFAEVEGVRGSDEQFYATAWWPGAKKPVLEITLREILTIWYFPFCDAFAKFKLLYHKLTSSRILELWRQVWFPTSGSGAGRFSSALDQFLGFTPRNVHEMAALAILYGQIAPALEQNKSAYRALARRYALALGQHFLSLPFCVKLTVLLCLLFSDGPGDYATVLSLLPVIRADRSSDQHLYSSLEALVKEVYFA